MQVGPSKVFSQARKLGSSVCLLLYFALLYLIVWLESKVTYVE